MGKKNSVDLERFKIGPDKLCVGCDPSELGFKTTEALQPFQGFIGQDRAEKALRRAFSMPGNEHNVFAIEAGGSGRSSAIRWFVEKIVQEEWGKKVELHDWCYVYNFEDQDAPRALRVAKGAGRKIKSFTENSLLKELRVRMPSIVSLKNVSVEQKEALEKANALLAKANNALPKLQNELRDAPPVNGLMFGLEQYSNGGVDIKVLHDGAVMRPEEFAGLPEEQRARVQERLNEIYQRLLEANKVATEYFIALKQLEEEIIKNNIRKIFNELTHDVVAELNGVELFFDKLREYTAQNYYRFLPLQPGSPQIPENGEANGNGYNSANSQDPFLPFRINVFEDKGGVQGAPIVVEDHPTIFNLFGKLERRGSSLLSYEEPNHMDLKPGSVTKANGGVLIITDALELFKYLSWDGLRRVLLKQELNIEDLAEQWIVPLHGLKPQAIPIKLKVVLVGSYHLYHALAHHLGGEFTQIVRIPAQFDYETERTDERVEQFAQLIRGWCGNGNKAEGMLHLDASAVAQVLRQSSRAVDNQNKLSLNMREMKDLCAEASCIARLDGQKLVSAKHVEQALYDKVYRVDFVREKIYSHIQNGTLLISIEGAKVGQVNGLVLYGIEGFSFGSPARITCNVFAGRGGVISIDKEVQLSEKIYNKGHLIISGYLNWKYGTNKPLTLSATISFEQSYGALDGDSASAAELYLILSSLSGVPLRQDIAVTGSVNQKGEIQPIGGVNEKIEGFFDICCLVHGLTGKQGVVIPKQNVQHLILRPDVVEAVKNGQFHIYAIGTIEEGVEILTGKKMGERIARGEKKGQYPSGTINYFVEKRLAELRSSAPTAQADK